VCTPCFCLKPSNLPSAPTRFLDRKPFDMGIAELEPRQRWSDWLNRGHPTSLLPLITPPRSPARDTEMGGWAHVSPCTDNILVQWADGVAREHDATHGAAFVSIDPLQQHCITAVLVRRINLSQGTYTTPLWPHQVFARGHTTAHQPPGSTYQSMPSTTEVVWNRGGNYEAKKGMCPAHLPQE
jgi:hypothetical protein